MTPEEYRRWLILQQLEQATERGTSGQPGTPGTPGIRPEPLTPPQPVVELPPEVVEPPTTTFPGTDTGGTTPGRVLTWRGSDGGDDGGEGGGDARTGGTDVEIEPGWGGGEGDAGSGGGAGRGRTGGPGGGRGGGMFPANASMLEKLLLMGTLGSMGKSLLGGGKDKNAPPPIPSPIQRSNSSANFQSTAGQLSRQLAALMAAREKAGSRWTS